MRESTAQSPQRGARAHRVSRNAPALARLGSGAGGRGKRARRGSREHLALQSAFCSTVVRYLLSILPRVTRELAELHERARAIPDPALRALALDALAKRGNIEGAALFAVLAPRSHRAEAVRALVAFQAAYNYLDNLAEQPSADPPSNGRQLHEALLVALEPAAAHGDYYAHHPQDEDGGYLAGLIERCRSALLALPSRAKVSAAVWAAAARIVTFQSLNLTREQGGHEGLERWARRNTPPGSRLQWWETAAANGSSLAVHALIATAARPDASASEVTAIEAAYAPSICALHSMLDSLVDAEEDERTGQRNLLDYHSSPRQAAFAMRMLTSHAGAAARGLADARTHEAILAAMVAYYLSSPGLAAPEARVTAANVADAVGPSVGPALALFRFRRLAARVRHGGYS